MKFAEAQTVRNIFSGVSIAHDLVIFILCFTVCAYFYSNGAWNQVSRLDAIQAFVENESPDCGTFSIDRFVIAPDKNFNTGDWAFYDGHYYSNKAPGATLLGIPFYAFLYYTEKYIYPGQISPYMDIFNAYMINLFVSCFFVALGAVVFRRTLSLIGISNVKAVFFALAFVLCTPLFPYSTQLWGHTTAAAFVIFSIYNILKDGRRGIFLAGLSIGISVLVEYLSIVFVFAFAGYILFHDGKKILHYIAGGIVPFIIFVLYHYVCFDSPFIIATMLNNPIFLEKEKVGGIMGSVSLFIFVQLLISLKKGLLIASPVLLLAIPAFIGIIRKNKEYSGIALLSGICILLTLSANSSFNGWHGGECLFPRYLIISLPFWMLLAALWDYKNVFRVILLSGLSIISFFNMLVVAALSPNSALDVLNPLAICYQRFFEGKFTSGIFFIKLHAILPEAEKIIPYCSFNLGTLAGLKGFYSIIPVFIIIATAVFLLCILFNIRKALSDTLMQWKLQSVFTKNIKIDVFYTTVFFLVVLLTILFPGNSVWINDEPFLAALANEASQANIFASHGLGGTVGITYGPIAVWVYQLFFMFTNYLVIMVFMKTLLTLIVIMWACRELGKEFSLNYMAGFIIFAASPYMYFYSRLLWDNVFLIPVSFLAAVYLMRFLKERSFISLTLCAILNVFCFYLHPMSIPLSLGCCIVLLFSEYRFLLQHYLKFLFVSILSVIAALPNILNIFSNLKLGTERHSGFLVSLRDSLMGIQNLSFLGFADYFFPDFLGTGLIPAVVIKGLIWASFLVLVFFFLNGVFAYLRGILVALKDKRRFTLEEKLALFALSVIMLNVLMNLFLRRLIHPHYFNAVAFALFFITWKGVSFSVPVLVKMHCVIMTLLLAFLVFVIDINGGNRGIHYGATLENQINVAETIITYSKKYSKVDVEIAVDNYKYFPHSLDLLVRFLQSTELKNENRPQPLSEPIKLIIRYSGVSPAGFIEVIPAGK